MVFVECRKCGETFDINILTGECYRCGEVGKVDTEITKDFVLRGKIDDGETMVEVYNQEGTVVARGRR